MTEAEWLASTNPEAMLESLGRSASARKLRLFSCACCRRNWHHIWLPQCREAVEVAERYADGDADADRLELAYQYADPGCYGGRPTPQEGALHVAARDPFEGAKNCASHSVDDLCPGGAHWASEFAAQAVLLRDIFGNPFHPVRLAPAWRSPTVMSLAQAAYDERLLPSGHLDPARLAVLADSLEEAGCSEQAVLDHLRHPGAHVRGCWSVDLLLARE
jgi:hypothetical protein